MDEVILVLLAGFCAALVDGALGMGFGPTGSTILLSAGLSPAAAAGTVNLAKVVTGVASAVAHWRCGNIDWGIVRRLVIPGGAGALIGVTILNHVDGDTLRPFLALLLFIVGLRILQRFSEAMPESRTGADRTSRLPSIEPRQLRGIRVAAVTGGVTNGLLGAWGPIVTPFLLHRRIPPRWVVGSVNTAEVAVAAVSAGSVVASLGTAGLDAALIAAMLAGGVLAAPAAAVMVRHLPPRPIGIAVAALLLVTNTHVLLEWAGVGGAPIAYGAVVALVGAAALRPRFGARARLPARSQI